jgi:hypothetical protein
MALSSNNHYNFMTIWLFRGVCEDSLHSLRVLTTHCNQKDWRSAQSCANYSPGQIPC